MGTGDIVVVITGFLIASIYVFLIARARRRRRERRKPMAHSDVRPQALYDQQVHIHEGGRGDPGLSGGGP